mmetsp:Transcript_39217/g.155577  ORF Transcript_39217/g.155577 Transcript_39217/m.155577 type:complete len:228 (-) Transcript_39217:2631-3314(-)
MFPVAIPSTIIGSRNSLHSDSAFELPCSPLMDVPRMYAASPLTASKARRDISSFRSTICVSNDLITCSSISKLELTTPPGWLRTSEAITKVYLARTFGSSIKSSLINGISNGRTKKTTSAASCISKAPNDPDFFRLSVLTSRTSFSKRLLRSLNIEAKIAARSSPRSSFCDSFMNSASEAQIVAHVVIKAAVSSWLAQTRKLEENLSVSLLTSRQISGLDLANSLTT